MKNLVATFAIASSMMAISTFASASGTHDGGHHTFGEPGKAEEVKQTINIEIVDANGDMKFLHAPLKIKKGDVVKFVIRNNGAIDHEFSIGDSPSQRAHAVMMEKMPDMKHENDATAVTLAPGETKELIWAFTKTIGSNIELACQMPGHYEAGMVSKAKMVK
jgi:uncharacterized cupredoxin-like copper-binding protein